MSHTPADLESAIDKLASANFTDAEVEALAGVIGQDAEVAGFGYRPDSQGWIIIESLKGPSPKGLLGDDLGILRGGDLQTGGSPGEDRGIVASSGTGSI